MDIYDWLLICAVSAGSIIMGISIGMYSTQEYKKITVEHGCAYYHPQTAEFTWVEK